MLKRAVTNCSSAQQERGHSAGRAMEINHVHSYRSIDDPDTALVDALRSRELTAFDDLIKRHKRRLLRVAQKITKNREDAEDAVQDSFLKVFRHLDSFRGDSKFASWLTRITINQALMAIRVKTQKFVSLDDRMEPEDGAAICQIEARGYTPEQLCSQHEFECLFRNLAASVRQSSRRVFELHIANDLSGLEIARALGLTPSVVKACLHRAKHDLRRTMSKYPPLTGVSRIRKIGSATTNSREDIGHQEHALSNHHTK